MTALPPVLETFGAIDIYLFDQLQKGRITEGMSVLDAGCGGGRNLLFLSKMGCSLTAVDRDPAAVARARSVVQGLPPARTEFLVAPIEALPLATASFEVVLSSAVLHFADDHDHFSRMVDELWRVLVPGGLLFARLASLNGIESRVRSCGEGRFLIPDGSERYLVDANDLVGLTGQLGGTLLDPIKTTNVQDTRCMTTWVVRKDERSP